MIKDNIKQMKEYKPPIEGRNPQDYLLLDFNESTEGLPEVVLQRLMNYIQANQTNVYPKYGNIIEKLAKYVGVSSECLMLTNGSDQGIDIAFRAVVGKGNEVIIPNPTFAIFKMAAQIQDAKIVSPNYLENMEFPFDEVMSLVSTKTKLIVICNPNNPTGTLLAKEKIVEIAKAAPNSCVLVDECYFEFCGETVKDFVNEYPNIVITRTFSKTWSMASFRIGYIISNPGNISQFLKIRCPYDVNQFGIVALDAVLDNQYYVKEYVNEVNTLSKPMLERFFKSKSIKYFPSSANYFLIEADLSLYEYLKKRGILIRPRGEQYVRITASTKEKTQKVIDEMEGFF